MFGRMIVSRLVSVAFTALVLAGCSAFTPEPTVAPPPIGEVVPESVRTAAPPSPTPTASPRPSIEGLMHEIPAPESFSCRALNEAEREVMRNVTTVREGARAVDAGEEWSVVAFRTAEGARDSIVTNGQRFNWLGYRWDGYFRPAGVRLKGGPDAQRAALECTTR